MTTYALKQLDHVWNDGEAYALLGRVGLTAKSTLLNIILGLLVGVAVLGGGGVLFV